MSEKYPVGTLVFAKMKGFPYWPGVVSFPTEELMKIPAAFKSGNYCIFFFGSRNYSWVEEYNLKLYADYKDKYSKNSKITGFKKACQDIKTFAKEGHSIETFLNETSDTSDTSEESTLPNVTTYSSRKEDSPQKKEEILDEEFGAHSKKSKLSLSSSKIKHSSNNSKPSIPATEELPMPVKKKNPMHVKADKSKASRKKVKKFKVPKPNGSFIPTSISDSPLFNSQGISNTLLRKNIIPSDLNFGFLGLGLMGCGLLRNLLNSNHKVSIWNRTQEKCLEFISAGAKASMTPGDVIAESDITFCCVFDNAAAQELVFGNCGVLPEIKPGKAYVEMSGISPDTSQKIADAITNAGGRYLEVRFEGGNEEAEEGTLGLMAAGDKSLYDDCSSCFSAFSADQKYFPEVGAASTYYLSMRSSFGSVLHGMSELFSMSAVFQITTDEMINFIDHQELLSPFVAKQCRRALATDDKPKMLLKHLKKDLSMILEIAGQNNQTMNLTALANENLKHMDNEADIGALFNPSTSKKI